jgi:hypothetical protein
VSGEATITGRVGMGPCCEPGVREDRGREMGEARVRLLGLDKVPRRPREKGVEPATAEEGGAAAKDGMLASSPCGLEKEEMSAWVGVSNECSREESGSREKDDERRGGEGKVAAAVRKVLEWEAAA